MPRSPRFVAAASLVFTYLFFFEYLPPVRRVHIPFDLHDFHYPLADYAFQRLQRGEFPLWDPTIYSGMSFVGNTQSALFYPPTWILFVANIGRSQLSYQSLEDFIFLHVWAGFLICYLWLRGRQLHELACILSAGVFAFGGYACLQLQHLGLICGYVWIPLALWGIDEAVRTQRWQPLWKVSAALSLCVLAGYPPMWCVFAICTFTYAVLASRKWKVVLWVAGAMVASLLLSAVQLLPAWEAYRTNPATWAYAGEPRDLAYYISYFIPNYFDFGIDVPLLTNPKREYLYLGAPAILGLALLARRHRASAAPFLGIAVICFVIFTNPFNLVGIIVRRSELLSGIVRDWYYLTGFPIAACGLAAIGLSDFLKRGSSRPPSRALEIVGFGGIVLWGTWELARWAMGGRLVPGWKGLTDLAMTLAVVGFGLYVYRRAQGRARSLIPAAVVLVVGIDYKVFGTTKRFNAELGRGLEYTVEKFPGMEIEAYQALRASRAYRVLWDPPEVVLTPLRHIGLTTPQGFDPLLSMKYRALANGLGRFLTDRIFAISPKEDSTLQLLGVKYVIGTDHSESYAFLQNSERFRLVRESGYYKVF